MKLIDFKQLKPEKGIPYSRDHLRRRCKAGTFPMPIKLSDRRIAWIEQEVDDFVADQAAARAAGRDAVTAEPSALSAASSSTD
jgi:predicted DNA-binding transcriptional regulator AlpA